MSVVVCIRCGDGARADGTCAFCGAFAARACTVGCDLCAAGYGHALDGEFDAPSARCASTTWGGPRATPFGTAFLLYCASLGTEGAERKEARLTYFRAQSRVEAFLLPSLIARCERARQRFLTRVAAGLPAHSSFVARELREAA